MVEALSSVGFTDAMRAGPLTALSGGWKMKLALARAMLRKADLMLLDEPTNHLDVTNTKWLVDYLNGLAHVTSMIVSHDAAFLDKVISDVIAYEGFKLRRYRGNLTEFVKVRRAREGTSRRERAQGASILYRCGRASPPLDTGGGAVRPVSFMRMPQQPPPLIRAVGLLAGEPQAWLPSRCSRCALPPPRRPCDRLRPAAGAVLVPATGCSAGRRQHRGAQAAGLWQPRRCQRPIPRPPVSDPLTPQSSRRPVCARGEPLAAAAHVRPAPPLQVRPEAKAYYSLDATNFKFSFPEPGYLEGVKTKDKAILKMIGVTYAYPVSQQGEGRHLRLPRACQPPPLWEATQQ